MENKYQHEPIVPTGGASPDMMEQPTLKHFNDGYYIKLRRAGVCSRLRANPYGEKKIYTADGYIIDTEITEDGALLDCEETWLLFVGVSELVESGADARKMAATMEAAGAFLHDSEVFNALLLEGVFETGTGRSRAFAFDILCEYYQEHRARITADRNERQRLSSFLTFMDGTEAGRYIAPRQKDALINYICHPDKQRVHDELCAFMEGIKGQRLADVVRLCISRKILKRKPPFAVLRDAGAQGTEQAYNKGMGRDTEPPNDIIKAVEKMARLV